MEFDFANRSSARVEDSFQDGVSRLESSSIANSTALNDSPWALEAAFFPVLIRKRNVVYDSGNETELEHFLAGEVGQDLEQQFDCFAPTEM